jgi:hypothetical protein
MQNNRGMSFFSMPFCGEAMHGGNRGVSFFAIYPLHIQDCKAPKNGMNFSQPMIAVCGLDSSRFSGQWSKQNKGIAKKDTPLFISMFLSGLFLNGSAGLMCVKGKGDGS